MKFSKILVYFSLLIFSSSVLFGQQHSDHLGPLKTNPALVNFTKQANRHGYVWRLLSDSVVLKLPFMDDFSHGGPYPNNALWLDNAAFINNTYPICPPTIGVATLDGVNNQGQPYNKNCPPNASYPADSLTSRPINLAGYTPQLDSIYFSFYWQAGGRGMPPNATDTLLLQFRTSSTPWTTVWYELGYTPAPPDTGFHTVMIPLLYATYNHSDSTHTINPYDGNFQFRFKNYACTSANADQWNIDEVYLNTQRSYKDTLSAHPDVTFVYESPSLLANYEYMPWEQFTDNDLADTIYITEKYNGPPFPNPPANTAYSYSIPKASAVYGPISDNIPSFYNAGNNSNRSQTHIPIKSFFTYTPLMHPDTIAITQLLNYSGDWNFTTWNNTLMFNQIFSDFYAYDDGTAEASYFINGTTPLGLAEQFTINKADTLRGLELYFNYMFVNPANYNMVLTVWDNSGPGGSPGNILYENPDTDVSTPRTSDTLNGFTFYPFTAPVIIGAGKTIFVGWNQTNGDSLNIGFDLNTNSQSKIWYFDNTYPGGWQSASYQGSIMMRPVFGSRYTHAPLLQTSDVNEPSLATLNIYPNPANDVVNLSSPLPPNTTLKIYTADGRECLSNSNFYGNFINTSILPAGFYIVEVTPPGGQPQYQKLMIQR